jgi:hypothetical protein
MRSTRKERAARTLATAFGFLTLAACDHFLSVRTVDEKFSDGQADNALAKATEAIVVNNGSGDVECPVRLIRNGALSNHAVSNTINTEGQLRRVFNLSGNVKVVHNINFCGDKFSMLTIGCARPGSMIVEDMKDNDSPNVAIEGNLWAHEFGHFQGLGHRNVAGAIMNGTVTPASLKLNATECNAMKKNVPIEVVIPPGCESVPGEGGVGMSPCSVPILPAETPTTPQERVDIHEFVQRIYAEGVPFDEARQYGPADAEVLRGMLGDRRHRAQWPMIATVLGIIGDEGTASELIQFIQMGRGTRVNSNEYRAVGAAIVALGYLAERTGSPQALRFLEDAMDPQFWGRQTRMRWVSRALPTLEARDRQLANIAVMGLGLSGRSEASGRLRARWETLNGRRDRASDEEQQVMQEVVEQAMRDHGRVARWGLSGYYADRH